VAGVIARNARRPAALAVVLALALALALVSSASAAQPRVPFGFIGVNAGGGTLLESGDLTGEYDLMLTSGVQTVRQPFEWNLTQPYATAADVPADEASRFRDEGGIPTDWTFIDRQVAAAASRRMMVLPVVHGVPDWAASHPREFSSPPRDPEQYARFLTTLVGRYGPNGSFWTEHPELPRVPVRDWQIWNEPNVPGFWSDQPWAGGYVALLRAAHRALRAADPNARTVLAGLTNESWTALAAVYKAGARGQFDVVAVHPFTGGVEGVLQILRNNRKVMARNRDSRKPLMVTETSWTSSHGKTKTTFTWETTERGQAGKVRHLLRLLARVRRQLRIERVYWYTWMSADADRGAPFDYAGLRRLRDGKAVSKPALAAYRRTALELSGCRRKASRADRCSP
jgi:hypothetical protein